MPDLFTPDDEPDEDELPFRDGFDEPAQELPEESDDEEDDFDPLDSDGTTAAAERRDEEERLAAQVVEVGEGGHLDYQAGDSLWRVEKAAALLKDFTLERAELSHWHECLVGQGQKWEILRRFYGVGPCLAENPEEFAARSIKVIATEFGLQQKAVEAEIAHGPILYAQMRRDYDPDAERKAQEAFGVVRALNDDEATRLVEKYGFGELKGKADRLYAADRLRGMEHLLDLEEGKPIVLNAIRQELAIQWYDAEISELREESRDEGTSVTQKKKLRLEIQKLMVEQGRAVSQHRDTLKAMGATQGQQPSMRAKMQFQDSVNFLVRGAQEYMANGDNALIDGMFAAAEVKLLCTAYRERGPQYRPDIVVQTYVASQRFWDPTFDGNQFNREIARKLKKAWEQTLEAMADVDLASLMDAERQEDEETQHASEDGHAEGMNEMESAAELPAAVVPPRVKTDDVVAVG